MSTCRLTPGTAIACSRTCRAGSPRRAYAELGDRHVAYVAGKPSGAGGETQLRIRNLATEADKPVYRARSGGANAANITRPSYIAAPAGFVEHRQHEPGRACVDDTGRNYCTVELSGPLTFGLQP